MQPLVDYYRCPEAFVDFHVTDPLQEPHGYFRFGQEVICYGQTSGDVRAHINEHLFDASQHVHCKGPLCSLPFDPDQVAGNLYYERYVDPVEHRWCEKAQVRELYAFLRPLLPVSLRKQLQRVYLRGWDTIPFPTWPVDRSVDLLFENLLVLAMHAMQIDRLPFIWFWPEGYAACAMVTHDVETSAGRDFSSHLMEIDEAFGIKASFQIVPEKRYVVSPAYLNTIRERGCEVNVQGLNHDGRLFRNQEEFLRRAKKINHYAKQFGALGFRSPVMYRKAEWFRFLDFSYDMSTPNVAHLEPQRGGCCTVMPYFLPGGMLELPLTTLQDYSLFNILGDYAITLWQTQSRLILDGHGLMSFLTHPDYVCQRRAQEVYKALLDHLNQLRSEHHIWLTLPREVDRWWRERSEMELIAHGNGWSIEGPGSSRARLAYARLDGNRLVYDIDAHQRRVTDASA